MREKSIIALGVLVLLLAFNSESFRQRYGVILNKLDKFESRLV